MGGACCATLSTRMSPESRNGSTVDVDWIGAHLNDPDVRLVEIDVSRAAYDKGHIPGAVLWNAYTDLRDPNYSPVGLAELGRLLMRSGITPDTCVVTYGYSAPLGFWLLRAHGHEVELCEQDNACVAELGKLRTAARAVWSLMACALLRAFV